MTIDGLTLHYIIHEIDEKAAGCKVDKVHQPQPNTIILGLRAPGANIRLLICGGAYDSRMHITEHKYENPKNAPMFCMFLRKHITGARILRVEQTGLERIVNITLEAKDELGLSRHLTLVAELMGKYSNIILKDENNLIMDSLRHVTRSLSRVRCVLPSLEYETPLSSKLNPLGISRTTLVEMLEKRGGIKIKPYLSQILQGVSGQTAEEILHRYMPSGYQEQVKEPEKLADVILGFFAELESLRPTLYMHKDGLPFFYSPVRYSSVSADKTEGFNCVNELADSYYHRIQQKAQFEKKRTQLDKRAKKQIQKHTSALKKQLATIENAKRADNYKTRGDIITANIYRINKGMRTLVAEDYTTGETMTIPLDTRLSPAANAQKNYKRYNKLKSGLDIVAKRIQASKKDIAFLESVQVSLESSETMEELKEIEYELFKAGVLKSAVSSARATQKPSEPHRFTSSDGYTFYAGKNNRQNDMLTMKTAASDDIWLHTKDIPGSHVLITGAKGDVPDATLLEAAVIAATLSKARNSPKVAVDYTQRKNIRKPGGAKPGMVVYEGYNTIMVTPDKNLFDKLLVK